MLRPSRRYEKKANYSSAIRHRIADFSPDRLRWSRFGGDPIEKLEQRGAKVWTGAAITARRDLGVDEVEIEI